MASLPTIPVGLPQKGELLAGKYRIEDVLGAGGMGIVVSARHLASGTPVAIKFVINVQSPSPEAAARLTREAQVIGALRSEHVVRLYEVGVLPNGLPFMVMEHLRGTHLGRLLEVRGPFPVREAVDCILQAGEAIAEAHALGVVHRDLKPENLFVVALPDRSLSIKVLDFGLSKVGDALGFGVTSTDAVAGSPRFMAPEQMNSLKHVDARADLWSIGVILFLLLSGHVPYEGSTLVSVGVSIIRTELPPLGSLRADVPASLDAAVRRCLQRNLAQRVQSVAELAQELAPFASARGAASAASILRARHA